MSKKLHAIHPIRTILNAPKFLSDPIKLMESNISKYGDSYQLTLGKHPGIFTANPLFIQHVLQKQHKKYRKSPPHFEKMARYLGYGLLTIDGAHWLKQRRLIQPGFHRKKIAALSNIMNKVISEFMDAFDKKLAEGPVDLHDHMQKLAFDLVARSIFNVMANEEELQLISHHIEALQHHIIKEIRTPFLMPLLKMSGRIKTAIKQTAEIDAIVLKFIRERKESTEAHDDLLQMLLDARYEDTGEAMSDQQLLDEVKILFAAGHETSANALSWTWALLIQHPEWIQKLRAEVEQLGEALPDAENLNQLPLCRQVLEESMRLYPPAWITDRMAIEDDEFDGIKIPKNYMVFASIYGAHHHKDYWENPNQFDPSRFSKEQKAKINSAAYLPFGAGPRLCIGNSFAMMEMIMVIARMVSHYDFTLLEPEKLERLTLITLKPKHGVKVQGKKL